MVQTVQKLDETAVIREYVRWCERTEAGGTPLRVSVGLNGSPASSYSINFRESDSYKLLKFGMKRVSNPLRQVVIRHFMPGKVCNFRESDSCKLLKFGMKRVITRFGKHVYKCMTSGNVATFVILSLLMSSTRTFHPENDLYFATFTVVGWVDVFTRKDYIHTLYQSIEYCQQEKGLVVHAYVVMSNHVHLIISTNDLPLSEIVRDLKKHTSKRFQEAMDENPKESRRGWMLNLFRYTGRENPNNKEFQFWKQDSHPTPLWSADVIRQKIKYIHQNPVKAGIVHEAWHYVNSSAYDYAGEKGPLNVSPIWV